MGRLHNQLIAMSYCVQHSRTMQHAATHRLDCHFARALGSLDLLLRATVLQITGHSYLVYGPLCLGVTTLLFESTPLYPTASRYWELIAKHRCTTFYTSPTAIRALMKYDAAQFIAPHDLSSLRVIGSVGEPIGEPAWHWLHEHVGRKRVPIVDTYW